MSRAQARGEMTDCLYRLGNNPFAPEVPGYPTRPATNRGFIREHFGKPSSLRMWSAPDPREPDVRVHFTEWRYPGLRIVTTTLDTNPSGPIWIESVDVTHPRYRLQCGLHIGSSRRVVTRVLGRPDLDTDSESRGGYEYAWMKRHSAGGVDYEWHAAITVDFDAKGAARHIFLRYYAD